MRIFVPLIQQVNDELKKVATGEARETPNHHVLDKLVVHLW